MTGGPIEELVVPYDLQRVAQRAERRRVLFRSRLIGLGVTVLVVVGFGIWFSTQGQPAGIGVSVLVVLAGVGWAAVSYLLYRRAREASSPSSGGHGHPDRPGRRRAGRAVRGLGRASPSSRPRRAVWAGATGWCCG